MEWPNWWLHIELSVCSDAELEFLINLLRAWEEFDLVAPLWWNLLVEDFVGLARAVAGREVDEDNLFGRDGWQTVDEFV